VTTWSIGEAAEKCGLSLARQRETLRLLDAKIGSYERRPAEAPHAHAI
jgi:hypothetical protein